MKKNTAIIKKLVVVAMVLLVVTISVIAFVGVYLKDTNKLANAVADYTYSTEFQGNREYKFVLDTTEESKEVYVNSEGNICGEVLKKEEESTEKTEVEVKPETENATVEETKDETKDETNIEGYTKETRTIKANDDSVLTPESYKKSRAIVENRLKTLEANQYHTRLDEVTGNLIVELPDDDDANFLYEAISAEGKFKVLDSQNGLELMNNSHLKNAKVGYSTTESGYTVYLQLEFNKAGREILKNISKEYVETVVEKEENKTETENTTTESTTTPENATTEPEKETKYIEIKLDDQVITTTYFGEELPNGIIQIPLNQNITTANDLNAATKSANAIVTILNSGKMPNSYVLQSDNFLQSSIKSEVFDYIKIALVVIISMLSLVLIIKFKFNGLVGAILNIGYLAAVSLAMRYTGVIVTISCIITVVGIIVINFAFMYILLNLIKNGNKAKYAYIESMKKIYLSIIPVAIVSFVFTFMQNASVMGIGMILFWGIIIQALYNFVFTRNVYVLNEK